MFVHKDKNDKVYFTSVTLIVVVIIAFVAGVLFASYLGGVLPTEDKARPQAVKEEKPTAPEAPPAAPPERKPEPPPEVQPVKTQATPNAEKKARVAQVRVRSAAEEEQAARVGAKQKSKKAILQEIEKCLSEKRYATAVGLYKALLAQDPDNAYIYRYQLGKIYRSMGERNKELISYKLSLRLNPDDDDVYLAQGEALERAGSRNEAAASYQKALGINPLSKEAKRRLDALQVKK